MAYEVATPLWMCRELLRFATDLKIQYQDNVDRGYWTQDFADETLAIAKDQHLKTLQEWAVQDARAKAYYRAIQDAEASLIRQRVEDGDFEGMPELEKIYSQIKNRRKNGGALYEYEWVTVNCAPGVQLEDVQRKVEKFVNRKIVKRAEWVYEQRGTTEEDMGSGMHVHMLVQQSGSLFHGDFSRNAKNTFKSLVGNPNAIHILGCKNVKDVENRRKYMSGEKDDEAKMRKVSIDKLWRRKNNLLPYYKHENAAQVQIQEEDVSSSEEEDDDLCYEVSSPDSSSRCVEDDEMVIEGSNQ